jgi:WD40 repeat protein
MRESLINPFNQLQRLSSVLLLLGALTATANAGEPPVVALVFTPDGKSVVAASQSGVHVFSWPELIRQRTIKTVALNLHCLAFSPDGKQLAVGGGLPSESGILQVFTWPTGTQVARFTEHNDAIRSVAWLDDEKLISGSVDREIKLWTVDEKASFLTLKGHSRGVNTTCLLDDGKTLVSASTDNSLRVWNLESGTLIRALTQHTKPVNALAVRPAEGGLPMVASCSEDRTIRFWQPTIGRMVRYVRVGSEALNIAWTDDGTRLLAACVDGQVRVIDPDELKVTQVLPGIDGWAYAITVNPDDQTVALGGSNGQIMMLEIPEEKELRTIR